MLLLNTSNVNRVVLVISVCQLLFFWQIVLIRCLAVIFPIHRLPILCFPDFVILVSAPFSALAPGQTSADAAQDLRIINICD